MPGVEVGAYKYNLVLELGIGSGNFGIYIMDFPVVCKAVEEFQLHFDLLSVLDETDYAAVILEGHCNLGDGLRVTGAVIGT